MRPPRRAVLLSCLYLAASALVRLVDSPGAGSRLNSGTVPPVRLCRRARPLSSCQHSAHACAECQRFALVLPYIGEARPCRRWHGLCFVGQIGHGWVGLGYGRPGRLGALAVVVAAALA